MTCASCGSEIADKALVCYRCGEATTPSTRRPPAAATRSGWRQVAALLGLTVLVLAGLYLGQARGDAIPRWAAWVVMAGALGLLLWRRRRRRL